MSFEKAGTASTAGYVFGGAIVTVIARIHDESWLSGPVMVGLSFRPPLSIFGFCGPCGAGAFYVRHRQGWLLRDVFVHFIPLFAVTFLFTGCAGSSRFLSQLFSFSSS
jgi:hypothetical protein